MKKELGKWLMDIAKYLTTVLLLSSIFGDLGNPWILAFVILSSITTLIVGLVLVNEKKPKKEV